MSGSTVVRGSHTYRVPTIGVAEGRYTFEIVHIDRSGDVPCERRYQPGIAYETENTAMEDGLYVAEELAQKHTE